MQGTILLSVGDRLRGRAPHRRRGRGAGGRRAVEHERRRRPHAGPSRGRRHEPSSPPTSGPHRRRRRPVAAAARRLARALVPRRRLLGVFVLSSSSGSITDADASPSAGTFRQRCCSLGVPILLAGLGGLYCRAGRRRQHRPRGDDDARHLVRRLGRHRSAGRGRASASASSAARSAACCTPSPPSPSASTTSSPAWPSTSSRAGVTRYLSSKIVVEPATESGGGGSIARRRR